MRKTVVALVLSILTGLTACASAPVPSSEKVLYEGVGSDESPSSALNKALASAVGAYARELLGSQWDGQAQAVLTQVANEQRSRSLVTYDKYEITKKERNAKGEMVYTLTVPVLKDEVKKALAAAGLGWPGGPKPSVSPSVPAVAVADKTSADGSGPTVEEMKFLKRYVDTLTWMVDFGDPAVLNLSPQALQAAVGQANQYLTQNGFEVLDRAVAEKIKKDLLKAGVIRSGDDPSALQMLFNQVNAGMYLRLNGQSVDGTVDGGFTAQVTLRLELIDPSVNKTFAVISYNGSLVTSTVSAEDAQSKAVQIALYQKMPEAVDTAKKQLLATLVRGIRYIVDLKNTSRSEPLAVFSDNLYAMVEEGGPLKDFKEISVSVDAGASSQYELFFLGSVTQLKALLRKAVEGVGGFEKLKQVGSQGRTISYDTGWK